MYSYEKIQVKQNKQKCNNWNAVKKMTEIENEKVVKQISKNKYKRYRQQSK